MSLALLRCRMSAIDRGGADAARRLTLRYKHQSFRSLVQGIIDNPGITDEALAHGLRIRHLPYDREAVAELRRASARP